MTQRLSFVLSLLIVGACLSGPAQAVIPEGFSDVVLYASNSIHLKKDVLVFSGDVVVNEASPGPTLAGDVELAVETGVATAPGFALRADSIRIKKTADIGGEVFCNELEDQTNSFSCTGLGLPVFDPLPLFFTGPSNGPDIFVGPSEHLELAAGTYGEIRVEQNGSILFLGGVYNVRSISAAKESRLSFEAPAAVRLADRLDLQKDSYIGPELGSGVGAAEIVFYIAGVNGETGELDAEPKAAAVDMGSELMANFYVPNGTLHLKMGILATGAFLARDIQVEKDVQLVLETFFFNKPPVAEDDAATTLEDHAVVIDVLANDSDPNQDNLSATPTTPPAKGQVSINPDGRFTYSPFADVNGPDSFDYQVCDDGVEPGPLCATATVSVTIVPVNDAPTLDPIPNVTIDVADPPQTTFLTGITAGGGESQTLTVVAASSNPALVPHPVVSYSSPDSSGALTYEALGDIPGTAVITVTVTDDGGTANGGVDTFSRSFTVTVEARAPTNEPPQADPQDVFTNGSDDLEITLTGIDPESGDLVFTITLDPTEGTLSGLTPIVPAPIPELDQNGNPTGNLLQPPITSATVTYTPATADNLEDSFNFQVADPEGAVGAATVRINPPPETETPPEPLDTVVAVDGSAVTTKATPVTLKLVGEAPCDDGCDGVGDDVPLAFSLVVGSGPQNGTLSEVTQGSEVPQRTATVTYTPDAEFVSPPSDAFDFTACGIVNSVQVCDTATFTVEVIEAQATAYDQTVTTLEDQSVGITLTGSAGLPGSEGLGAGSQGSSLRVVSRRAALAHGAEVAGFSQGATVAGNVACTEPLFGPCGDNHNDLPGPTPLLMAAAVDSTGDPGFNGTVRMHMEWALDELQPFTQQIVSAAVLLNTLKGDFDNLDTWFYSSCAPDAQSDPCPGLGGDGLLTDGDYNTSVFQIPNVVMTVPDVPTGTEGTYSFDVTSRLLAALEIGVPFFAVQGRVDEGLAGSGFARGLQVRTSADGNLSVGLEPQLVIETTGVAHPLTFSITSLPQGILTNQFGGAVTVGATLPSSGVIYTPPAGFTGLDAFGFEVSNGLTTGAATVYIEVTPIEVVDPERCLEEDDFYCDNGRG